MKSKSTTAPSEGLDLAQKFLLDKYTDRIYHLYPDILCILSAEGNFSRLNPAFESLTGLLTDEVLDKPIVDYLHPDDREAFQRCFNSLKSDFDRFNLVVRVRTADERYCWIAWSCYAGLDQGSLFCVGRDVSAQKEAEQSLLRRERQLEITLDIAGVASWELDLGSLDFIFNDHFLHLLGTGATQEQGHRMEFSYFMEHFAGPGNMTNIMQSIIRVARAREGDYADRFPYTIQTRQGDTLVLEFHIRGIQDDDQYMMRAFGTAQPLATGHTTVTPSTPAAAQGAPAQLAAALKLAGLSHWELDTQNKHILLDDQHLAWLGATRQELEVSSLPLEEYWNRFVQPEDVPHIRAALKRLESSTEANYSETFEYRLRSLTGEVKHLRVLMLAKQDAHGKYSGADVLTQEITHQRRAEEVNVEATNRLELQEKSLNELTTTPLLTSGDIGAAYELITRSVAAGLNINLVSIWLYEPTHQSIYCACFYDRQYDAHSSGQQLEGTDYSSYFKALYQNRVIATADVDADPRTKDLKDYHERHGIVSTMDAPIRRNGEMIGVMCCEHTGQQRSWYPDEQNFASAVACIISSTMEASDRFIAYAHLHEREREAESLRSQVGSSLAHLESSDKWVSLGQLIAGIAHEVNTPIGALRASSQNIERTLPLVLVEIPTLLRLLSPEAGQLLMQMVQQSISIKHDFTTQEERQHRQAVKKMLDEHGIENSFELAKDLVEIHIYENLEVYLPLFQNPYAAEILDKVYKLAQIKKNLDNIDLAAEKTSRIVRALKAYSHVQAQEEFTFTDLGESFETILTVYENQLKYGITVEKSFQLDKAVPVFPDELGQVWTNLISNAVYAMNGSGTLALSLHEEDGHAIAQVTDNGPGIPPEVLPRIFEPFYTTKPQGEGSGLGLDIVRKIVEKHQGTIAVESKPGRTQFTVRLPLTQPTHLQANPPQ